MPRSTYYRLRNEPDPEERTDPIADAVEEEFRKSGGRYGARRIKKALAKREIVAATQVDEGAGPRVYYLNAPGLFIGGEV